MTQQEFLDCVFRRICLLFLCASICPLQLELVKKNSEWRIRHNIGIWSNSMGERFQLRKQCVNIDENKRKKKDEYEVNTVAKWAVDIHES